MSVIAYLFGAAVLMLVGALAGSLLASTTPPPNHHDGLTSIDKECPKCGNKSLYKRHCKIACEQCGVIE